MSGESMPVIITKERVTSKYLRRARTLAARDLADLCGWISARRNSDVTVLQSLRSCVVDGLAVTPQAAPNMTVQIATGMAFAVLSGSTTPIPASVTNEDSNYVMLNKRAVSASVAVAAADPTLIRYDLIELMPTATPASVGVDESAVVDVYDEGLGAYAPTGAPQPVMVHGEPDVVVTTGTPGVGNSCPTPTAGRIPIAVIRVLPAAVAVNAVDILDVRQFLGERMEANSSAPSRIDTQEISIDVPANASTGRICVVNLDVRAGGVPGSMRSGSGSFVIDSVSAYTSFLDPAFSDYGVYAGWVYLWMIVEDDKGLRYSRAAATNEDGATGSWSHRGVFTISKVAPSLTNGALTPSGAIKTPYRCGNSTCTPGTGKAVCVGVIYWSGGRMQHGIRMNGGEATFVEDEGALPALTFGAWTHTAAGASSTTQSSAYQADLTLASNPKGPLAFDVWAALTITNGGSAETPAVTLVFNEQKAGDASGSKVLGVDSTTLPATGASSFVRYHAVRGLPVSRISTARGATTNGLRVTMVSVNGVSHTTQLAAATPPTTKLLGYRWPQGPVVA